jgi:hypothetical protein
MLFGIRSFAFILVKKREKAENTSPTSWLWEIGKEFLFCVCLLRDQLLISKMMTLLWLTSLPVNHHPGELFAWERGSGQRG